MWFLFPSFLQMVAVSYLFSSSLPLNLCLVRVDSPWMGRAGLWAVGTGYLHWGRGWCPRGLKCGPRPCAQCKRPLNGGISAIRALMLYHMLTTLYWSITKMVIQNKHHIHWALSPSCSVTFKYFLWFLFKTCLHKLALAWRMNFCLTSLKLATSEYMQGQ